jgi:hypothetical protein
MKKAPKPRPGKLEVLDRSSWTDEFRKRLRDYEKPKNALRELTQKGCLEGSLLDLLYAYTFSPTLVFEKRAQARAVALDGLRSVARRLKNASKQMQDTLDLKMMEGWDLTRMLRERAIFKMPAGCYASTVSDSVFPDFALDLPAKLRECSSQLGWLRSQLQREFATRQVQNPIYLAELATYIEAVTGNRPSWTLIAYLLSAARPTGWPQKDIDPMLLSKNYKSFVHRNKNLYQEIQGQMTEYLSTCAQFPEGQTPPSIGTWKLAVKASHRSHL